LSPDFLESELFGHQKGAFTGAATAKVGLLEVAHRGTFFLDEIGDVDVRVQPKLLKVLEDKRFRRLGEVREREVDVRLIAASHQDLRALVREHRFREDLFFRISTLPLEIPPLRDRREDIRLLAEDVLERVAAELGRHVAFSEAAVAALEAYPWPGNIREMRNVLERAVLLRGSGTLEAEDLYFHAVGHRAVPAAAESDDEVRLSLSEVERRHVERVLRRCRFKVSPAARILGISRTTLYQKIKTHDIVLAEA
jgi:transcriptional regulator with PAS, ATPase and Fis domain